jgi:hypothetical protein
VKTVSVCAEKDESNPGEQTVLIPLLAVFYSLPFIACTATCTSKTFNIIWQSLGFGHWPFWGIDVGCGRPNLLFLTQALENTTNPVLDVLNILPQVLDANTPRKAINKSLFYFDSEEACRLAVRTLRKVLPNLSSLSLPIQVSL